MGQLLQILFFTVTGAVILFLNIWWFTSAPNVYDFSKPIKLGSVKFISAGDKNGDDLPPVILSQINDISDQIKFAIDLLQSASTSFSDQPIPVGLPSLNPDSIPTTFERFDTDIELNVGGVDLGPILNMIIRNSEDEPAINITINPEGNRHYIYGHYDGLKPFTFRTRTFVDNAGSDEITEAIAFAIIKEISSIQNKQEEMIAQISHKDYRIIMKTLIDYAEFVQNNRFGEANSSELEENTEKIFELSKKFNKWHALQWLSVRIATETKNWDQARLSLNNLLEFSDPSERKNIQARIDEIDRDISNVKTRIESSTPQAETIETITQLNLDLSLIRSGGKGLNIAFVGATPGSAQSFDLSEMHLDPNERQDQLANYSFDLLSVLEDKLPNSTIHMIDYDYYDNDLVTALSTFLDSHGDIDLLIVTLGIQYMSADRVKEFGLSNYDYAESNRPVGNLLNEISKRMIVVAASGEAKGLQLPIYSEFGDQIFNASSTNKVGDVFSYSGGQASADDNSFWVPGFSEANTTRGSGVAAMNLSLAIAAIISSTDDVDSLAIRTALNSTKRKITNSSPEIIDVNAAISFINSQ